MEIFWESKMKVIPVLLVVGLSSGIPLTPGGPYNTNASARQGVLNVHIVPHTHDDVGWLKTVDELFLGKRNDIQISAVQHILDSVMNSLSENNDRKFIYVEMAFFSRWWRRQDLSTRSKVIEFVRSGQLEFINGGWASNDEATPTFVDIVDQHSMGAAFIAKEFGAINNPTVGWQVDPFGHSKFQARAYKELGMNAWFFGRSDGQDYESRKATGRLESVHSSILAGSMDGYGPPPGFNWDILSDDDPLNDDVYLGEPNIQSRLDEFVSFCSNQSEWYNRPDEQTKHIMLTMGSDFHYNNADTWFKSLDRLIHYANLDGRVNVFYSTPSVYAAARASQGRVWSDKSNYDWFPYCDSISTKADASGAITSADGHAYWTGYFSSRPLLKRLVREASSMLEVCRIAELISVDPRSKVDDMDSPTWVLWEALSVVQHHDGVSGTSRERVAWDYMDRLDKGISGCRKLVREALTVKGVEFRNSDSDTVPLYYHSLLNWAGNGWNVESRVNLDADAPVNVKFAYYDSSLGETAVRTGQASGAYIFRPDCPEGKVAPCRPKDITKTDWIKYSLFGDRVEWEVGPIPRDNGLVGKEIVLLIEPKESIKNGEVFYTDSNGYEWMRRSVNKRSSWEYVVTDPVSGNYYPVTSGIAIRDGKSALIVTPDRSVGGTSLQENQIEIMIHRRNYRDDDRGLSEPLDERDRDTNEPIIVKGTTWFKILRDSDGREPPTFPVEQHQIRPRIELGHIRTSDLNKILSMDGPLSIVNTPNHIQVTHLYRIDVGEFCVLGDYDCVNIRLRHVGREEVRIDFGKILKGRKVVGVVETALHAGKSLDQAKRTKINWVAEDSNKPDGFSTDMTVIMRPGEYRTFILSVDISAVHDRTTESVIFEII
jgi:hypothetical protein